MLAVSYEIHLHTYLYLSTSKCIQRNNSYWKLIKNEQNNIKHVSINRKWSTCKGNGDKIQYNGDFAGLLFSNYNRSWIMKSCLQHKSFCMQIRCSLRYSVVVLIWHCFWLLWGFIKTVSPPSSLVHRYRSLFTLQAADWFLTCVSCEEQLNIRLSLMSCIKHGRRFWYPCYTSHV